MRTTVHALSLCLATLGLRDADGAHEVERAGPARASSPCRVYRYSLGVHNRRIDARVYPSGYNERIARFEAFATEA